MHETLTAYFFARYLERRQQEDERRRTVIPENRFSVGMQLFRKIQASKAD
ncbi:hypothetical protein JJB09_01645 [Rhizobium sp. KVB221]|uniref:Uncharacterized protein n=1 Tax=Rhizobium setariae TaxID=2801340 RepID=A0A936YM51_9HYPH|nr:hypothetical protein [Rhizobium setariae]MBL0370721.1 hypothetical protein [Rhizobium setariae]